MGHLPVGRGKERVISAHPDVFSGPKYFPALPNQDISSFGKLVMMELDTKTSTNGIASIGGRGSGLFGSHATDASLIIPGKEGVGG